MKKIEKKNDPTTGITQRFQVWLKHSEIFLKQNDLTKLTNKLRKQISALSPHCSFKLSHAHQIKYRIMAGIGN